MKTLSILKRDLEFNRGLTSLIEVLKNIAVAQYRVLEHKIKSFEQLIMAIEGFFEFLDCRIIKHPFVQPQNKPTGVIAITSDGGLLGGLNMQVVTRAVIEIQESGGKIIVIGERGKMYVQETGMPFISFSGIRDEERYAQAMQLRDYCLDKVLDNEFGSLKIIYPRPISFTVQRVETVTVLPFAPSIAPSVLPSQLPEIIFESRLKDILEYLVYLWMGQKLYEIFGLSRLSEFAARYVHLEGSLQRLKEVDVKTRLEYFRVRHELIDRNMRELFSARLLYA